MDMAVCWQCAWEQLAADSIQSILGFRSLKGLNHAASGGHPHTWALTHSPTCAVSPEWGFEPRAIMACVLP
jgi:hypothetical protein